MTDAGERPPTLNLAEIEARLKAATPGPWSAKQMHHAEDAPWFFVLDASGRGPVLETVVGQTKYLVTPEAEQRADVEFIAHAPDDVAALLGALREMRAALAPFAALLHRSMASRVGGDDAPVFGIGDHATFTVGDVWRAARVLATVTDTEDT